DVDTVFTARINEPTGVLVTTQWSAEVQYPIEKIQYEFPKIWRLPDGSPSTSTFQSTYQIFDANTPSLLIADHSTDVEIQSDESIVVTLSGFNFIDRDVFTFWFKPLGIISPNLQGQY